MEHPLVPPRYIVDLSLPPEERYTHIAEDFREEIKTLPTLYDEILSLLHPIPKGFLYFLSRLFLRRLYSEEETREIKGISKATGVELFLLVAFNVILDVLMGCTSGGVRVDDGKGETKMLHFRTLDWGMESLRKVVVELDFVEHADGPVIATSVLYFGYVGILTGVRKGLSISLNFRPTHDRTTRRKRIAFRIHQLMVILGRRRAVGSSLRQWLLPQKAADLTKTPRQIAEILKPQRSTAAYLTFCDGRTTVCMDNDYKTARFMEASDLVFLLNHDFVDEYTQALEELRKKNDTASDNYLPDEVLEEFGRQNKALRNVTGKNDLIEASIVRKNCLDKLWVRDRVKLNGKEGEYCVSEQTVLDWMMKSNELCNEETHYAVIMDPTEGRILWLERYIEPLESGSEASEGSYDEHEVAELRTAEGLEISRRDHEERESAELRMVEG